MSIPGGYFLNWKQGLRRVIPEAVTLMRWRSILNDAAANDRVALLYSHPHNLIDGPGTLELFEGVRNRSHPQAFQAAGFAGIMGSVRLARAAAMRLQA